MENLRLRPEMKEVMAASPFPVRMRSSTYTSKPEMKEVMAASPFPVRMRSSTYTNLDLVVIGCVVEEDACCKFKGVEVGSIGGSGCWAELAGGDTWAGDDAWGGDVSWTRGVSRDEVASWDGEECWVVDGLENSLPGAELKVGGSLHNMQTEGPFVDEVVFGGHCGGLKDESKIGGVSCRKVVSSKLRMLISLDDPIKGKTFSLKRACRVKKIRKVAGSRHRYPLYCGLYSMKTHEMLLGASLPLYQVNLSRPCTKKEDTVSLTVGADPTIGLRRKN
nr:hypothetical protein [Tanacetum cinerariifolium]